MSYEFLKEIGQAFVPKRFRPYLRNYLMKAGIDEVPYKFFGGLFFATVFITITTYFGFIQARISGTYPSITIGIIAFTYISVLSLFLSAVSILLIYFYLNIKIYRRTKLLESKLVDYFTLVSTNLKGGLSFEKSLWMSIKPEFGILAKEIGLVSKKVMTGNDLSEALIEFSMKYDSPILRRSMNLIIGEIESGGTIVKVIDKVIENLRKTNLLKEEMAASTITYMIFIGAIVMVISPALFALSAQLLQIVIGFANNIGSSLSTANTALPFSINSINVDMKDFRIFSYASLATISIFSALIISIIEKGNARNGLKYVPLFLSVSLFLFSVFDMLLTAIFSGFLK